MQIIDRLLKKRGCAGEIKILSPSSSDIMTAPEENFLSSDDKPAEINQKLFKNKDENRYKDSFQPYLSEKETVGKPRFIPSENEKTKPSMSICKYKSKAKMAPKFIS